MYQHQDWNVVVFKKPSSHVNKSSFKTFEQTKTQKLETNDPSFENVYISSELAKAITSARCLAKLSQEQLAQKACVNCAIIKEIESAKAIYNPTIISKIAKCLGLKTSDIKKTR